jgi:FlaA1/EpsC-like NDP-sugar epimerase
MFYNVIFQIIYHAKDQAFKELLISTVCIASIPNLVALWYQISLLYLVCGNWLFLTLIQRVKRHYNGRMFKDRDLKGQNVVITGGTDGIGAECVRNFYRLGATIIFTGRSDSKAETLIQELTETKPSTGTRLFYQKCDLSDFKDVISAAKDIKRLTKGNGINILLNNAGAVAGSKKTTKDNCDFTVQVNYLS